MHVKEGTVLKLLCPDTKCGAVVPPKYIENSAGGGRVWTLGSITSSENS
jgi:hypothetical protein